MSSSSGESARDYLASWSGEDREYLFSVIEESDYSLADWIEAIRSFEQYLAVKGEERRPWREMAGYLHCCTQMASPGIPLGNLKVIVNKALTEFGFEFMNESQG